MWSEVKYIGHADEKRCLQPDNIIVNVFRIIACSERTASFMVSVTVTQLPECLGTAGAQSFTAGARAPAAPSPLAPQLPQIKKNFTQKYLTEVKIFLKVLGAGVLFWNTRYTGISCLRKFG